MLHGSPPAPKRPAVLMRLGGGQDAIQRVCAFLLRSSNSLTRDSTKPHSSWRIGVGEIGGPDLASLTLRGRTYETQPLMPRA